MNSLSFPDVNVWLALAVSEHVHSGAVRAWWAKENGAIAFSRFTQLGLLRLLTTAAAMDGKPLGMRAAWQVYDRFFEDDRVRFASDPSNAEDLFRSLTRSSSASPKAWADAWMLAMAAACCGRLVTLDRALSIRGAHRLLLLT